ncbi:putative WD-repeat protein [Trypanosoma grayi]|uniref:putative WD-repeat protein n=1 Tax=Trypanosoma grayi TaxID=71804 RepID=UPI0004F46E73|nr:putative WD-repeat protein [Trypanosoma grayi]KEG11564.1 putative WD-repeat protein [Trypanosoma grayi]
MCVDTTVELPDGGEVCNIAFSADCFTLATGLRTGRVLLWDLRKMSGPLHEIPSPTSISTNNTTSTGPRESPVVAFDGYGKYLAVAGRDIRLFNWAVEPQQPLCTLSSHVQPVTSVCWGENALSLISCSTDRTVKLYGSA